MRAMIGERYPRHGIVGEEFGDERPDSPEVWVLGPDRRHKGVRRRQAHIRHADRAAPGRQARPRHRRPAGPRRTLGRRGRGRVAVLRPGRRHAGLWPISPAPSSTTTSPELFQGADRDAFGRLSRSVRSTGYGGDCYAYGLLASGHIDLVVEAGLKTYDFCALVPVVEGGRRTHLRLAGRGARPPLGRPGDRDRRSPDSRRSLGNCSPAAPTRASWARLNAPGIAHRIAFRADTARRGGMKSFQSAGARAAGILAVAALVLGGGSAAAEAVKRHGLTLVGKLGYPADFAHRGYGRSARAQGRHDQAARDRLVRQLQPLYPSRAIPRASPSSSIPR